MEHEGHWACRLAEAAELLYDAARTAENVCAAKKHRSVLEEFALWKLRLAIAKAEGHQGNVVEVSGE